MPFPKPTIIPTETVTINNPNKIKDTLNSHGVAVIPLSDINGADKIAAIKDTQFYRTANNVFKVRYEILDFNFGFCKTIRFDSTVLNVPANSVSVCISCIDLIKVDFHFLISNLVLLFILSINIL